MECSICHQPIDTQPHSGWDRGHHASPVTEGRCCTRCNDSVVIPARIHALQEKLKVLPQSGERND